jgi:hypothetical protein
MTGFERGILYIATGPSYLTEAVGSAQSVRAVWPEIPLALITDIAPPPGCFDHVEIVAAERSSRDKPSLMGRSPFEQTIFLDADTYCCAPFPELFDQLDRFELLAAHEDGRFSTKIDPVTGEERFVRVPGIPESFPELNTGVMAFRRTPATTALFECWIVEYDEVLNGPVADYHDQPSFRAAIYRSAVQFGVLPSEYNFRLGCPGKARTQIKIIHGRWTYEPIAPTRAATMRALDRAFNANHGHRAFVPALGMIYGHGPLAHSPADPERVVTLAALREPAPEPLPEPAPEPIVAAPEPARRPQILRELARRATRALRGAVSTMIGSAKPAEASRQTVP